MDPLGQALAGHVGTREQIGTRLCHLQHCTPETMLLIIPNSRSPPVHYTPRAQQLPAKHVVLIILFFCLDKLPG